MRGWGAMLVAVLLGIAIGGGAMVALRPHAPDDAVRTYLLAHPEVIPEAMDRLQQKRDAALVAANRAQITTRFAGALAGNPEGDVTVTEFYDYACGYCRQSVADVDRLVTADKGVRVIFKEMPVLSAISNRAAQVALAAAKANRFMAFHHALYAADGLDEATIARIARANGVDPAAAAAPDIAREIDASLDVVRALKFQGTPTFVIGDRVLAGAVGFDALKQAVDETRAEAKAAA